VPKTETAGGKVDCVAKFGSDMEVVVKLKSFLALYRSHELSTKLLRYDCSAFWRTIDFLLPFEKPVV